MSSHNLYEMPSGDIDYEAVRRFVLGAEEANLLTESLTLELKAKVSDRNVVDAIVALSNTDGGLVLVGVAEGAEGEARLVGVPQAQHDRLVGQLHSLIPTAIPEVIPVRVPSTELLIIVLRVNADAVQHPVMVGGRIVYRVPGATVPADRQRVIELLARDQHSEHLGQLASHGMTAPSDFPLWNDDGDSLATLRLVGGLVLPQRIVNRPWLTTAAREAALVAVQASPLPERCWGSAPRQLSSPEWLVTEARSRTLRLVAPSGGAVYSAGDVPLEVAAYVELTGRRLTMLLGLRWSPRPDGRVALATLENLYHALLAAIMTIAETCDAIALALDAAAPTESAPFEGWLQPRERRVFEVLDIDQFPKDGTELTRGAWFPRSTPTGRDTGSLDALARTWLTVSLLDMGLKEFELWLDALPLPSW